MKFLAFESEVCGADRAGATSRPRKSELARTRRLEAISGDRKGSAPRSRDKPALAEAIAMRSGRAGGRETEKIFEEAGEGSAPRKFVLQSLYLPFRPF